MLPARAPALPDPALGKLEVAHARARGLDLLGDLVVGVYPAERRVAMIFKVSVAVGARLDQSTSLGAVPQPAT